MSLSDKIWNGIKKHEADIVLIIGIILIALISFGGGFILGERSISSEKISASIQNADKIQVKESISIQDTEKTFQEGDINKTTTPNQQQNNFSKEMELSSSMGNTQCKYVGSKNSNVYHLPDCPGAKRIKEENKRCFSSKEEAEKAGYRPAANCPGI